MNDAPTNYETPTFLIVDDDKVSVKSIRRAIGALRYVNPIAVAGDGVEALEHLRDAVEAAGGTLPHYIVLLDLSMPRMDGHEFLETVRRDPVLARLVVFVITTSDAPQDVDAAYARNVAGYILKDSPQDSLREALGMIGSYARLVVLPG